jgi:thiazole/oxazole-forming peptide maturase SagD family component
MTLSELERTARLAVRSGAAPIDPGPVTRSLERAMLSPLCGLSRMVGCTLRGYREPRFLTAGVDLTGVHVLRGTHAPPPGFYHIGGGGILRDEALIRALGETAERYCQMIAEASGWPILRASYDALLARGEPVIDAARLRFFTDDQHAVEGFPFRPFCREDTMGWVSARSLITEERSWIPAQLLLVGYAPRIHDGESWLTSAVTTGTAAHTDPRAAVLNGLLEIVQVDAAMGHWYADGAAVAIEHDDRTAAIERIVERQFFTHSAQPSFYVLPSADLPGTTVACVIRGADGQFPAVAVGLGTSFRLAEAMYKALLEGVGVSQLAKFQMMQRLTDGDAEIAAERIFDLDSSVPYHAMPPRQPIIDRKFPASSVTAGVLPADLEAGADEQIARLVSAFAETGKELFLLDITSRDVADLGLTVARLWSPDTVSLCLPSAPPLAHPRLRDYGRPSWGGPHPYP